MRRGMGVVIALMLVCSLVAVAGDKAPLSDRQLSSITAGSDFGSAAASGAVVANGSSATIAKTGSIALQDAAQSEAKALNVLNSIGGAIGSGINVWDGKLTTDADAFKVTQKNLVVGSFGAGAHVSGYFRDPSVTVKDAGLKVNYSNTNLALGLAYAAEARRLDVAYASDKTFGLNATSAFSHDESQAVAATHNTAFGLQAAAQYANANSTTATASQDTAANLDAGFKYVNLKSLDIGYMQHSANSSASNYQNAGDPSASGASDASGFSKTGFGLDYDALTKVGGGLDASYSNKKAFGYNHTDSTTAAGALAVGYTNDRSFAANAAESTKASRSLGISAADSKRFNLSAAESYKELLANVEYAKTTFGLDLTIGELVWKGAMGFDDADAEYIVVDDSKLDVTENYGIALGGNAQSKVSAVNLVNAANSLIGIGTNVARTPVDSDNLHFSQTNTIILK
jgi:hypothetical protein